MILKFFVMLFFLNAINAQFYFSLYDNKPKHGLESISFDGLNANAPQGGEICFSSIGSFDHLNPFTVTGNAPILLQSLCFATLMKESQNELFMSYPYVATHVKISEDKKSITFILNPEAIFSDGSSITAEDVLWSFEYLIKTNPKYKSYYHDVMDVKIVDSHTITFASINPNNKELPAILGQLPIFCKKYFIMHMPEFGNITEPYPVSGPYIVKKIDHGKSIVYEKVQNWWGGKIFANVGQYNFERFKVEYYRERNAAFQDFLTGNNTNIWIEASAKQWQKGYNVLAVEKGNIKKEILITDRIACTRGFVFNLRKNKFKDIRIRKAINLLFNFDSLNRAIFYEQYKRLRSYYGSEELPHRGKAEGNELKLLEPFKDRLPKEVFEVGAFESNSYSTDFVPRDVLQQALDLFKEAGWEVKNQVLTNQKGESLEISMLFAQADLEKIILHLQRNLELAGIKMTPRMLDTSSYTEAVNNFDYDMCPILIPQSHSLGNEQKEYFGSKSANIKGSQNLAGIENEAVDNLIEKIINAQTHQDMLDGAHALDRVLCWNYYIIMGWSFDGIRIAYWDRFERPKESPKYLMFPIFSWWCKDTTKNILSKSSEYSALDGIFAKIKYFFGMN